MNRRIAAEYVYTLQNDEPIINGYVEFDENGTILGVGKCSDEDTVIKGALVPGFVNAHCHLELSHLHKKFRKGTGMAGFIDQINALRDWASDDVKTELVEKWMDKLWKDGVSAVADISNDASSFPVKKVSPIYTRTFLEVFGTEPEDCAAVMESVGKLHQVAQEYGIDAAPTPHSCYTMSPQLLSASSAVIVKFYLLLLDCLRIELLYLTYNLTTGELLNKKSCTLCCIFYYERICTTLKSE